MRKTIEDLEALGHPKSTSDGMQEKHQKYDFLNLDPENVRISAQYSRKHDDGKYHWPYTVKLPEIEQNGGRLHIGCIVKNEDPEDDRRWIIVGFHEDMAVIVSVVNAVCGYTTKASELIPAGEFPVWRTRSQCREEYFGSTD